VRIKQTQTDQRGKGCRPCGHIFKVAVKPHFSIIQLSLSLYFFEVLG
jgi:hypothetical protein